MNNKIQQAVNINFKGIHIKECISGVRWFDTITVMVTKNGFFEYIVGGYERVREREREIKQYCQFGVVGLSCCLGLGE